MAEKNFIVRNGLTVTGGVTIDSDISIGGSLTVGGAAVTPGLDSAEIKTLISGGTGITYTEATGVIATDDTAIVHDNLSGFVADEHVAHSTINIVAGDGLTGGGTIDSNVTINVVAGTGLVTSADAIEIATTGVVAGSYGSASQVPVFSVNAQGQIDSATTVSVAGVSSTSYDSSTGIFTISTADGGSFNTTFHDSADLESRARYAISATGDLSYSPATGVISYSDTRDLFDSNDFDTAFATKTTDDLTEGSTNLYYDSATTVTVARNSVSVTDAGGDGSLTYSAGTGVITYTGPSASEVRAHFSAGTGVTLSSGQISIGQAVATSSDVTFNSVTTTDGLVVGGNLQVNGTTTTISTQNLSIEDNMFYLNQLESAGSPTISVDVGWAANVNDPGSYQHVGMFRDATDDTFKVFEGYTPEPDSALEINTGHASFSLAPFAARTLTGKYLGADSDIDARLTGGTGITYSAGTISTNDAQIVHDNLSGFVANEHIDHSGVSITAGAGLTGGGTIAATRTLNVGAGTGITVNADDIAISNTGVAAATYGDSSTIPVITVNAQGQITAVVGAGVNIPAGYGDADVEAYLSGGTGITFASGVITNAGVTSVNSLTGAITATNLLDAIKTVDGAGSGLDADLLDGQSGAYYRIDVYNAAGTLLN